MIFGIVNCLCQKFPSVTVSNPDDCITALLNNSVFSFGRLRATCSMADDGEPTCDACPQGYGGRTCDKLVHEKYS